LNGGLFDPIGNYDWVHTDILLPNELFSNTRRTKEGDIGDGILDIFNRYNFTVKEDEPLEKEVAIDPELLGKAYEKFNAIRPDNYAEYEKALKSGQSGAESKFNKQYGVYYTPREIVHYICQQSLINYLTIKLEGKVIKEDIETLIKYGEQVSENEATVEAKGRETSTYFYKLSESIRQNAKLVDEKLTNIKVCDPAIGSGAFPVGMMSEIVKVRNVLSVYIKDSNRMPYRFKRECIEKSLYGVDIDAGAVEIAKLRLWLSLVVDEEDIKQIKPLPNLDYKIVCGDSLLGVEKDLLNLHLFNELERLKPLLFDETSPKKKQEYKKQIDEIINQITKGHREFDFEVYFSEVFHEKKGFDVVIANPPYIGEKGHKEIFREVKKGPLGKFYLGKMDYFYFFFHLSLNIAGENSSIAFITTNYYPTAMGAKKLRQDFKERVIIKNLMNFNELKIFESALGQHNMITILQKGHDETALAQTCITQKQGLATAEVLQQILNSKDAETQYYKVAQKDLYDGDEYYIRLIGISFISDNPIQIILNKLKKQGSLLDIICNVKTGLRTGIDKSSIKDRGIFILNHTEYKNLHLDNCEVNLFKPFFKNSDIQKYRTNLKHTYWVIYIGRNSKINLYQNIRQHLLQFKHEIESARWKERIPWYALVRTREQKIFESPKIVVPHRSRINCFAYNDISWYASSDVYFITEKDKSVYLKYVLSLLNSKLYYLWLYHRGKRKGETLELYQKPLSEIPIKKISESQQQTFITLVDRILAITKDEDYLQNLAKQAKVKEYERQIDQTVYKLYGLIPEEIKIVENFKND
jgi:hypothetical protein